ncbi:MAG TPA: adenylate/guanylate cyclase domain-containing protein [Xanthobacteraceae bacterium]|nr:adenylate/guanylate cyclase domain-containing protein [Xanthobacteraceae bacterium]
MPTLMAGIGVLVLVSVGAVMAVNWIAARDVVGDFATALVTRLLAGEEAALRRHLDVAVHQGDFIAAGVSSGRYKFADPAFVDFVGGSLAAAPQVDALAVGDADGNVLRVLRLPSDAGFKADRLSARGDGQFEALGSQMRTRKEPYWGRPVYRKERGETFLNYRVPIWSGESYLGFVVLGISTRALSRFAKDLSPSARSTAFMLYEQDRVLAHPLMAEASPDQAASETFPPLRTFGDPVIADLTSLPLIRELRFRPPPGVTARRSPANGQSYFIFAREVADYKELPITVGTYVLTSAVDAPIKLLHSATLLALAMLGISLIGAAIMATAISRPIRRAAKGAAAIGRLDFDQVAPLAHSGFREIESLAVSFNAMLDALRAFGRYVPRTLVLRLIKEGGFGAGTEERIVAIMFTDIVGFTATCEKMAAPEVAAFINQHLTLISACVVHEGGTIDKFIGDAMMAFWGAPARLDNPAAAACRAAIAIQKALAADNEQRVAAGLAPVRIRIGIHMGPVVVGDIGAPNRINYTIVGDAVNAAQRLESLGKAIDPDSEAIVLVSHDIAVAAPEFRYVERGAHLVKGKQESLNVYQLAGAPDGGAEKAN